MPSDAGKPLEETYRPLVHRQDQPSETLHWRETGSLARRVDLSEYGALDLGVVAQVAQVARPVALLLGPLRKVRLVLAEDDEKSQ